MKKILFLSLFMYVGTMFSQITYNKSDYASGTYSIQMTTVTAGVPFFNYDTTGANITWDFSGLGKDLNGFKRTVSPGGSGYQVPYITQCILGGGGFTCPFKWNNLTDLGTIDMDSINMFVMSIYNVTTLMSNKNNKLVGTIKGLKVKDTNGLTVPLVADYSHKDTILQFPLTYLSTHQTNGAWGIDLNSLGQNIGMKSSYQRNYRVEGWGKLITPFKTYNNVLKVKTKLKQIDSLNFRGTKYGIPRKIIEYTWYDKAYKLPVMKAEGLQVGSTIVINSVSYHDTVRMAGVNDLENFSTQISLFPNPAKDILNINFSSDVKVSNYRIVDAIGREISSQKFKKSISISSLERGNYYIQFFNQNQFIGVKKFVVLK